MIFRSTKLIIFLAVAFSFLASLSVFLYLKQMDIEHIVTAEQSREVVVVKRDIEAGESLKEEDVSVVSWPERLVPSGSFENQADVMGKVVMRDIFSGEPVLMAHFAKDGVTDGIASLMPTGMRAMTVSLKDGALSGDFLSPDSRVDVLATIRANEKGEGYTSKLILQNIKVLSVNKVGERGIGMGGGSSVTLLVTPEEAERLALAESQGTLYLVLRNIADRDFSATMGATISSLIGTSGGEVESKKVIEKSDKKSVSEKTSKTARRVKRPEKVKVEVIRGMEREEMVFENP